MNLGNLKKVRDIVIEVFKNNNIEYYNEEIFGRIHSFWGNILTEPLSIHIDMIEGYFAKGYEIYSFKELYSNVEKYKNFYVLNDFFSGIMIYIYKQFGYKKPKLKEEYKNEIYNVYMNRKEEFFNEILKLTDKDFAIKTCKFIENKEFDKILQESNQLNKFLRKYVKRKHFFSTIKNTFLFNLQRLNHSLFRSKNYNYNFAVIAPDGTGKTTFLENLIDKIIFYRVCRLEDNHISLYHFRPNILPNLGAIGEKAGVMKQDKDFTNPHRRKPAGKVSSFLRIMYYSLDYIIGWNIVIRKDSRRNKWSIFDRYSYDLLVDPYRTRLNLPEWIRRFFVALTPKPNITFFLSTEPEIIYERKQELELTEIKRQLNEYKKINARDKRIRVLDASLLPEKISDEAIKYLFEKYMKRL